MSKGQQEVLRGPSPSPSGLTRAPGLVGWYEVAGRPGLLYREVRFESRLVQWAWVSVLSLLLPLLPERVELVVSGERAALYLGDEGERSELERERLRAVARWLEGLRRSWLELARLRGLGNELPR
jgi:hypothetical protein